MVVEKPPGGHRVSGPGEGLGSAAYLWVLSLNTNYMEAGAYRLVNNIVPGTEQAVNKDKDL